MSMTRRQLIQAASVAALASAPAHGAEGRKKRVLAVLGDAYHAVAYLDGALVAPLRKAGWEAETIMDYNVPWDDFAKYDLIIQSREAHEYVRYFRSRDSDPSV